MAHFTIKTRPACEWCDKAKALLTQLGHAYTEQMHDTPEAIMGFKRAGFTTFPQIFRDGVQIGGYSELVSWALADAYK